MNSLPANEQSPYQDQIQRSAVDQQHIITQLQSFDSLGEALLYAAGQTSDGIRPWGTQPTLRDRQLRSFLTQEPYTLSAVGTVIARNMGLAWHLDGPSTLVEQTQEMFHRAHFGQGWETFGTKIGWDYQTQDKAAFMELVRDEDNPDSPVVMFNQLDAGRCWHTGNPQVPVIYQDRLGRWHGMKWYQCLTLNEMPVGHETLYGLQYSSLTRMLVVSQIMRNILRIDEERSGGRWSRSLHILSGVKKETIEDALKEKQEQADNLGLMRYSLPGILTTTDPLVDPKLVTLSLSERPSDFKMDEYFSWYMTAMAMGLLVDYGELAPLPGARLGTGQQSQVMHAKSRTKGVAIWTNKIEHQFNFFGVVPRQVSFKYDDKDLDEDKQRAEVFLAYSQAFVQLQQLSAIDAEGAIQMLLDEQMMPQDVADGILQRAKQAEADQKRQDAAQQRAMAQQAAANAQNPNRQPTDQQAPPGPTSGRPSDVSLPDNENASSGRTASTATVTDGQRAQQRGTAVGQRDMTVELGNVERVVAEDRLTAEAKRALESMAKVMKHKLAA
jgi:hypothetical protein